MNKAIEAFLSATTEKELADAYQAMLEWSEAPEGREADDVDTMLERLGHPSLYSRLCAIQAA